MNETVSFLEGRHAAAEGARKRKTHQATCAGCDACDHDAEAKAEARAGR